MKVYTKMKSTLEQEIVDEMKEKIETLLREINDSRSDKVVERDNIFLSRVSKLEHLLPEFYWSIDKYGEVVLDEDSMREDLDNAINKANELIKELGYDK